MPHIERWIKAGKLVRVEIDGVPQDVDEYTRKHYRNSGTRTIPVKDWPLWAKALKQFAKPEDKGIGDVVARIIGEENSAAFSAWHLATFGKPCNCKGRQARWNKLYPLNQ